MPSLRYARSAADFAHSARRRRKPAAPYRGQIADAAAERPAMPAGPAASGNRDDWELAACVLGASGAAQALEPTIVQSERASAPNVAAKAAFLVMSISSKLSLSKQAEISWLRSDRQRRRNRLLGDGF